MSELTHEIEKMEAEIEKMQKQLNRAKELNKLLGDNPSHADASCATSWLLHSDLTPVAIIDKIKGSKKMSKIYCPVNGWDCPYWKKDGTCGMWPEDDPMQECDDFAFFWDPEDDYICEDDEE